MHLLVRISANRIIHGQTGDLCSAQKQRWDTVGCCHPRTYHDPLVTNSLPIRSGPTPPPSLSPLAPLPVSGEANRPLWRSLTHSTIRPWCCSLGQQGGCCSLSPFDHDIAVVRFQDIAVVLLVHRVQSRAADYIGRYIRDLSICKYRATYGFGLKHALVCRNVSSSRYCLAVFRGISARNEVEVFVYRDFRFTLVMFRLECWILILPLTALYDWFWVCRFTLARKDDGLWNMPVPLGNC